MVCNYLFFSWGNKKLTTIKGKTLSRGTNSRLPFGVNVNPNLSNVGEGTGKLMMTNADG